MPGRDAGRLGACRVFVLTLTKGCYSALHILCVLGFMALACIRRPEQLRHHPPGELGKAVGLDRVPEVCTLREKIAQRATLLETIQFLQTEREALKARRRATPRKIAIEELSEAERPRQLLPLAKALTDTIKMIAYRAETALVGLLRRHLANEAEARALIRELFVSGADLEPDETAGTLTIRIHRMASPVHDRAITLLLDELTSANYCHPETGHRFIYQLV